MKVHLEICQNDFDASLNVPGSKSISNRILIFQALSDSNESIENISTAKDTLVLQEAIQSTAVNIDVGDAGTAFRFLTSYYSVNSKTITLTGSARMKKRPINDLVNALRLLGADIDYLEQEGFPPLKICGRPLVGGEVPIDSGLSSQFVSSLLMIAPILKNGLDLHLIGPLISAPYIQMTLDLMSDYGIKSSWNGDFIRVFPGEYVPRSYRVEPDWSSISYLFELVALSNAGRICVEIVDLESVQGDQIICELFSAFGVIHSIENGRLCIFKDVSFTKPSFLEFDCTSCPDLAQTIAATATGMGIHVKIKGLYNLSFKETDRLKALKQELEKTGVKVKVEDQNRIEIFPGDSMFPKELIFESHGDHRMAMSLAPLALKVKSILIEDAEVVIKSYPHYWEDLKLLSFKVHLLK